MKKTRVYIDGYNLYYGLLKGTPWKWLDLELFSKGLLNPDHEIVSIVYFTAPVKTHPHDPAALVNITVTMLLDAVRTDTESFALITGDSDQVGAIEALRYELGKSVLVFNPHAGLSQHLKRAASYYKNIPRDLPARCQLPDEIPVGTHGNVIRRPAAWK